MRRFLKVTGVASLLVAVVGVVIFQLILPGHVSEAVEAELALFREHADITYESVDISISGTTRLENVVLRHKTLPYQGQIGVVEIAIDDQQQIALTLFEPTLQKEEVAWLEGDEIQLKGIAPTAINDWVQSGGATAPRELGDTRPFVQEIEAASLVIKHKQAQFYAKGFIAKDIGGQLAEDVSIDKARWRWTDDLGDRELLAESLRIGSINHAYLRALDADWSKGIDGLAANAPDGLIADLTAKGVTIEDAIEPKRQTTFGSLRVSRVENAELVDIEILDHGGSFDDHDYVFGKFVLDRLPLWLIDGWATFEATCEDRADCKADPVAAAGRHLLERMEKRGGLRIDRAIFSDGEISPHSSSGYAMRDISVGVQDLHVDIGKQGEPFLSQVQFAFAGTAPINSLGARERTFLLPAGIKDDLRFTSTESVSTDLAKGRSRGVWRANVQGLGSLSVDLNVTSISSHSLDLRRSSPAFSPLSHLLTTDGGLDDAQFRFENQGLIELYLDNAATQGGQKKEAIIAALTQQLQFYGQLLGPSMQAVIPELTRFIQDPKSLILRLDPENPVPLSSFATDWATEPQGFWRRLRLTAEANR